jgi:DNA-binding CsgD family transcriptional regulator
VSWSGAAKAGSRGATDGPGGDRRRREHSRRAICPDRQQLSRAHVSRAAARAAHRRLDRFAPDNRRVDCVGSKRARRARALLTLASISHHRESTHVTMTAAVTRQSCTPSGVAAAVAREFAFTPRESQVLRHAACGKSIKEIAFQLGVSAGDIEYFWRRIFAKLGCGSQLCVMALLLRRACTRRSRRRRPSRRPTAH